VGGTSSSAELVWVHIRQAASCGFAGTQCVSLKTSSRRARITTSAETRWRPTSSPKARPPPNVGSECPASPGGFLLLDKRTNFVYCSRSRLKPSAEDAPDTSLKDHLEAEDRAARDHHSTRCGRRQRESLRKGLPYPTKDCLSPTLSRQDETCRV